MHPSKDASMQIIHLSPDWLNVILQISNNKRSNLAFITHINLNGKNSRKLYIPKYTPNQLAYRPLVGTI
jgi:hypothetical protein